MWSRIRGLLFATCLALFLTTGITQMLDNAQAAGQSVPICFHRQLHIQCVERRLSLSEDLQERLHSALAALMIGPSVVERAAGIESAIPYGAVLSDLTEENGRLSIYITLPARPAPERQRPLFTELVVRQIGETLRPYRAARFDKAKFRDAAERRLVTHILVREEGGDFVDLSNYANQQPLMHKDESGPAANESGANPAGAGFLSGKAVYLSAGHGYYWSANTISPTESVWVTQRPIWQALVEDFNNAEVVNQYLLPYLTQAGADVWTVRERDLITAEVTATIESPEYTESGQWQNGLTPDESSSLQFPWRTTAVSSVISAQATWHLTPSITAEQSLYVWYDAGPDRAPDAHYLIAHAGGVSEVLVDQTVHGSTWRFLGRYPFYANQPAAVTLANDSSAPSGIVNAGAVRIGGGMGSELGGWISHSPTPSGRPRWEEATRYWAAFQGAPPAVYAPLSPLWEGDFDLFDDVTARPRYAEWEKPVGEDALFLSWHTNGSLDHDQRGTESYIYDGTAGGIWTPGSDLLQYFTHQALVEDIRAAWDSEWPDQGMLADNFGEVRLLESMPGVLLEIGFHDDAQDTLGLLDPRFAHLSARAVYRGIVRYYAHRDGQEPVFLPEAPAGLSVQNSGPGQVTVSWLPSPVDGDGPLGDAADQYRVYTSPDGFAWDTGREVSGTTYIIDGLSEGRLIFARVSGVNEGGESWPSETMGARTSDGSPARLLFVNGYTLQDRDNNVWQDDGITIADTDEVGLSLRLYAWRHNRLDYVIQHGQAISLPFDSASRKLLSGHDGQAAAVNLFAYDIVDWMTGEQRAHSDAIVGPDSDPALSAAEQTLMSTFLRRGGALFLNGAEIGFDLVEQGYGPSFYREVLKAIYQGHDAFQRNVQPYPNRVIGAEGGFFADLPVFQFDNGQGDTYYADHVDFFLPAVDAPAARSQLLYQAGIGHAAHLWDSGHCGRLFYVAFPFETILTQETRGEVMRRILDFLDHCGPRRVGFVEREVTVEQGAEIATLHVTLDDAAEAEIAVSYTTQDGSATAGVDYLPVSGRLSFEPGNSEQTIRVPLLPGVPFGGQKTIELSLLDSDGALIGERESAVLRIEGTVATAYLPVVNR